MQPLFLTGGGGFVGRHATARLARAGARDVRLLARDQDRFPLPAPAPSGWRVVQGDLGAAGPWTEALRGVDTVLHLAALTGKASRREHVAANRDATRRLVEAARAAGVRRFLFVSSIAAGYRDRAHYHYANAKAEAEAIVTGSGLEALIVRPTMVLGPGSPVLANLARLACLPLPVTFGPGQLVQPVHVEDLAAALVALLDRPGWGQRTVEIGGPERIGMDDLAGRIRAARGLPKRPRIRLPLQPLRALLALVEPVALTLLPFTAGQLAAYANPAVATPPPEDLELPRPEHGVDAMVAA